MKAIKLVVGTSILLFCGVSAFAQPGKNGNLSIATNTVVNRYSPVTADIAVGSTTLSVLNQTASLKLCPGDLIMIYQAQGALISTVNSTVYGAVLATNGAGHYNFAYVKQVSGNTITTTSARTLSFSAAGKTQVVYVPQYATLTINANASVLAQPWRDTVQNFRFGGIVALHANVIVNNGTICADAAGFRGGKADTINFGFNYQANVSAYLSNTITAGGEKGESIAGYQQDYDALGGRYGRGAPANGGGGGNGWNSGGGGGANAPSGSNWTGQGCMDGSVPGAGAWALDPGYIANGNMLTTSTGGGRGGYSVAFNSMNPLVNPPGDSQWGGDSRKEVGGLGGRSLNDIDPTARIFFGGGGGSGDDNNLSTIDGGNGGGIVYVMATTSISGNGIISALGGDGGNTKGLHVDAASGGGAGGSVVVLSPNLALTQTLSVAGGHGGSQFLTGSEAEGPGGGGGGGLIACNSSNIVLVLAGGSGGDSFSSVVSGFPSNGATAGAKGQFTTTAYSLPAYNAAAILTASVNSPLCAGDTLTLSSSGVAPAAYNWTGPSNFAAGAATATIPNASTSASGIYTLVMTVEGCSAMQVTVSAQVNKCEHLGLAENTDVDFSLFPNPAQEQLNIFNSSGWRGKFNLLDATGKIMFQGDLEKDITTLDLSQLPAGLYILHLQKEQSSTFKKLVVQH